MMLKSPAILRQALINIVHRRQNTVPSLKVNFVWTLAGNLVYSACQWGIIIAIAKLGTPAMVGQFTLGLAITAPVFMLSNLQLRAIQATDARDEYRFDDYLYLRIISTFTAIAIILGFIFVSGYGDDTAWIIILITIAKGAESISDIIYGVFQKYERMDLISTSLIIRGILSLGALGITLKFSYSLLFATLIFAVSWIIMLISFDIRNLRKSQVIIPCLSTDKLQNWNFLPMLRLAYLALPLGIVMMLISLNINLPRYFLERFWSSSELGYFAAMSYLALAGNTLVTALGQSASPRLARYYVENLYAFEKLLFKLLGLAFGFGVVGILVAITLGSGILSILYRPDYTQYQDVFILLMLGMGISFVSSVLGYGLTAMRLFTIQVPMFLMIVIVTYIICQWFMPAYGMIAAAWAFVVSNLLQTLIEATIIWSAKAKAVET